MVNTTPLLKATHTMSQSVLLSDIIISPHSQFHPNCFIILMLLYVPFHESRTNKIYNSFLIQINANIRKTIETNERVT